MCDEATKKRTRSSLPSPPLPSEVKKGPRLSFNHKDFCDRMPRRTHTRCVTASTTLSSIRGSLEGLVSLPRTTNASGGKSMVSFAEPDPAEFLSPDGAISVQASITLSSTMCRGRRTDRRKGTITLSNAEVEDNACDAGEEDSVPVHEDTDGITKTSRCDGSRSWACNPFSRSCVMAATSA